VRGGDAERAAGEGRELVKNELRVTGDRSAGRSKVKASMETKQQTGGTGGGIPT